MSQLEEIIRPIASEIVEDLSGPRTLGTQVALTEYLSNEMSRQKLRGQQAITQAALAEIGSELIRIDIEERSWTRKRLKDFLVDRIENLLNDNSENR